jgi:arginine decarboxylase
MGAVVRTGLDNLARPEGVIQRVEEHASRIFDAGKTYLLVNGSTVGILAAVHAFCPPGTMLLTSRASHASVFNAISLSGTLSGGFFMMSNWMF